MIVFNEERLELLIEALKGIPYDDWKKISEMIEQTYEEMHRATVIPDALLNDIWKF